MPASNVQRELIVFPTELALRRYQQNQALENGWVDASGHTTFARLRNLCLPYVLLKGRRMNAAEHLLMRRQVVEVAHGHFAGQGTLGVLSDAALSDVLEQLIKEMASLPGETTRIIDWMLDRPRNHKLYQLGTLFSVWRAVISQEGLVDTLDVNMALLKLLRSGRTNWPPLLREARGLTFRSVRWFSPFEEACVLALNQKMKVRIESALPTAHAEAAADRLGQRIGAEIIAQPWAMWTENLGDALAVDCPDMLQLDDRDRINFSRSSGDYGEIEDLARRISWYLEAGSIPPGRIALVVPSIGAVQDIIPHVFSRFRIPYYFRRGRPVLSSPCVKAFLAWLSFPLRPERDTLIDLVRNPAVVFDRREETVSKLLRMPPRIDLHTMPYFNGLESCSGKQAAELLKERIAIPDDHFNAEALNAVGTALDAFGEHAVPLRNLIDLLEELLEDATIRPRDSHEQGVWILNPFDAVGLDFDFVLFAGLNEGEFPAVPRQDALLSDNEREWLRRNLEDQSRHLPAMALPKADVLFEQQSVLFLSAIGMAREQLVLSYQSADQEGNEKSGSEFFRKLWNLAGWYSQENITPCLYDQWRIRQLGKDCLFSRHLAAQQAADPEDRVAMPGESFLSTVPLPLCRARDEALQTAVSDAVELSTPIPSCQDGESQFSPKLSHLVAMLHVEAEREAYLDAPVDKRPVSNHCGHIPALKEKIAAWFDAKQEMSPTALEALAQCRYIFLLERVFGLRDERMGDDMPDPMDRGTLIHSILREIYSAIANGEAGVDAPRLWAVKSNTGWQRRNDGGSDAVPLAVFVPELENQYIAFARSVAEQRLAAIELGHQGVWAAEREKVMELVLNFVRHDVQKCADENRFPALFELPFSGNAAVELGDLRLRGTIDRVDLIFADSGELEKVRVLDYKGSGRSRSRKEGYLEDIRRNLDCQLPVYALAAQKHFFGESNTEAVNGKTEAGYLFYERDPAKVGSVSGRSLVPMDEPGLLNEFTETLFQNICMLKDGDFSVDPLIASYNDYESICRTTAVDRDEVE
jgi:hypothetical protein